MYRGHIFHITGSPTVTDAPAHLQSIPDGALAVDTDGVIAYCGPYAQLPQAYTAWTVRDHRGGFLLPGFVDTHMHFPQTYCTDSYSGGQLLEWLEHCIFPAEARLSDPGLARRAAVAFCRRRIAAGTTAAMVMGSAFPEAQEALFTTTRAAGLRMVSGRGVQTVGPESARPLLTTTEHAIALCAQEIEAWHGDALTDVALVPRFSLSVTTETLAALGELYDGVRGGGVYFHSHLNENARPGTGEVDTTLSTYGVESYLDTYDGHFLPGSRKGGSTLLGRRSILAHGVHCQDQELARMAETGSSIAHCPTSQLFLGSGTMPWRRTVASGVNVALGTDVGAGDEWLLARVLNDCFKVHISEPASASVSLHPAELLFTATLAGARALDREHTFGNLDVGKEADFLVIDPQRWEPLADNLSHAVRTEDEQLATEQTLFRLLMGLREPAISSVLVRGRDITDYLEGDR
ncbi:MULTISPECIES: amidohydrolase family protein [unclassified Mycobacteroides]|uniref:amidohydrolase family protein n=1 Tax=unclassified Mycobacteroides TaxID=2618759 RepID=UPI0013214021|nr:MULTISPECIES: amidohydrolase family protein [unclassified Mycobacteroides]MUM18533.1 guanine deaminase [Mycobacteroides sp. CBMA 326]